MARLGIKKLLKQLGAELEKRPARTPLAERPAGELPWPMPGPVPVREEGAGLKVVKVVKPDDVERAPQLSAERLTPLVEFRPGQPLRQPTTTEHTLDDKPLVLEFSNVRESVLSRTVSLGEQSVGGVRSLPTPITSLPKEAGALKIPSEWVPVSPATINVRYPLIEPFAYAAVVWDDKNQTLTYTIMEPPLSPAEAQKLELVKELIMDLLDINLMAVREVSTVQKYLQEKLNQIIVDYGIDVTKSEYEKMMYYVNRNFLGLGSIEPMMQDMQIEDISCDGAGIGIFVFHRKFGSMKTNVIFNDPEELNKFVTKLSQRCGKHISVAEPLMDGALPDGSRVQATFSAGKDIAARGSTFTIRKFTKDPLTIVDFMNFGTIPALMGAYFWLALEFRNSMLISGGTASGKTSCLNVLCLFLPPELKIVSIEDTPELALPHEHWVAKIARSGYGPEIGDRRRGEVTMFDLLRAALRERPEELIVGEVRGKEAYVLFQGMASVRGCEPVFLLDEKGKPWFDCIEKAHGKNLDGWKAVTVNPLTKKVEVRPVTACVKHAPRKELFEIRTATGRKVVTTGDHSVFVVEGGAVVAREVRDLKEGNALAVPAVLPSGFADVDCLNLVELLPDARVVAPSYIKKAVEKLGWSAANAVCGLKSISDYYKQSNCSALRVPLYLKLLGAAGVQNSLDGIRVKFDRKSESFPAKLALTPELLRLFGYYLSEGSLNTARKNNSIALYNKDERVLDDMRKCVFAVTGKKPKERKTVGWGECTELRFSHKVLFELFKAHCSHGQDKRIPSFAFGLSKQKIGQLLSALYEGDGSVSERCVQYSTTSKTLAESVVNLLLTLGIVAHVYEAKPSSPRSKRNIFRIEFYSKEEKQKFLDVAKPLTKQALLVMKARPERSRKDGEVYADPVKEVRKLVLEDAEPVYDLCVPGTQNFVGGFGGVMLHNTGHAGLATLHAESVDAIVNRLITPPISLSPGLLQHLNILVIMANVRIKGHEVRRVKEVIEVVGIDPKTEKPITNTVFRWVPSEDYYEFASDKSYMFNKIIDNKGVSEKSVWEELSRRAEILGWLRRQGIRYYKDVGAFIALYYKNPDEVLKRVYGSSGKS